MSLVTDILLFPVMMPLKGLWWLGQQIQAEVEAELFDEERVHEELLQLQALYQEGSLSDEEYAEAEDALLERLNAIAQAKELG